MDRKGIWVIAAAILLSAAIIGISQSVAQRDFRTEPRPQSAQTPRYQVVNVTEAEVIIMDVTSGDLYSAKPADVKPYSARPRPGRGFGTEPEFAPDKLGKFDKDAKGYPDKDLREKGFDKKDKY